VPEEVDFDIALSFAGDHRPYVAEVAAGLDNLGFRVFYDQYRREDLLGQELISYLQDVYGRRSATVAAFLSQQYATRPWPGHERQSALAHALLQVSAGVPFLLPFRFDETPVPGLQPSVGYEDLRQLYPGERRWRTDRRYKHPNHVVSLLARILKGRGLGSADLDLKASSHDPLILIHFVWFSKEGTNHAERLISVEDYEEGEVTFSVDETDADGPVAGRYARIADHLSMIVNPARRLPVFLIDTFEAREKTWVLSVNNPDQELQVIDHVRRQVQQSVDIEIADGAKAISSTLTFAADDSPIGPGRAITGICVIATPAA
jgi:hypothetical protein